MEEKTSSHSNCIQNTSKNSSGTENHEVSSKRDIKQKKGRLSKEEKLRRLWKMRLAWERANDYPRKAKKGSLASGNTGIRRSSLDICGDLVKKYRMKELEKLKALCKIRKEWAQETSAQEKEVVKEDNPARESSPETASSRSKTETPNQDEGIRQENHIETPGCPETVTSVVQNEEVPPDSGGVDPTHSPVANAPSEPIKETVLQIPDTFQAPSTPKKQIATPPKRVRRVVKSNITPPEILENSKDIFGAARKFLNDSSNQINSLNSIKSVKNKEPESPIKYSRDPESSEEMNIITKLSKDSTPKSSIFRGIGSKNYEIPSEVKGKKSDAPVKRLSPYRRSPQSRRTDTPYSEIISSPGGSPSRNKKNPGISSNSSSIPSKSCSPKTPLAKVFFRQKIERSKINADTGKGSRSPKELSVQKKNGNNSPKSTNYGREPDIKNSPTTIRMVSISMNTSSPMSPKPLKNVVAKPLSKNTPVTRVVERKATKDVNLQRSKKPPPTSQTRRTTTRRTPRDISPFATDSWDNFQNMVHRVLNHGSGEKSTKAPQKSQPPDIQSTKKSIYTLLKKDEHLPKTGNCAGRNTTSTFLKEVGQRKTSKSPITIKLGVSVNKSLNKSTSSPQKSKNVENTQMPVTSTKASINRWK